MSLDFLFFVEYTLLKVDLENELYTTRNQIIHWRYNKNEKEFKKHNLFIFSSSYDSIIIIHIPLKCQLVKSFCSNQKIAYRS